MTIEIHHASRDRMLVTSDWDTIADVLTSQAANRSIVALLSTAAGVGVSVKPILCRLIVQGCKYFVCWGDGSEALHDLVDETVLECAVALGYTVITTWHDDETVDEVADFFFDVAAEKAGCLMVAILGESDSELARVLARRADVAE